MDIDDFLILRAGEADGLVTPAEALDAIEAAWREHGTSRQVGRQVLSRPAALSLATPAAGFSVKGAVLAEDGLAGFRILSRGTNARDWIWLADLEGRPLALIEASWLRALRTATTAALAARMLATPGATSAALIGAGRVAAQLPAVLAEALPGLAALHVASRRPEAVAEFCVAHQAKMALHPADSVAAAAAQADIVITLSGATTALLHAADLRPGATVIALGEADVAPDVLTGWAHRFVVDSDDFATPGGNLGAWIAAGAVTAEGLAQRLSTDLGLVAAGLATGREKPGRNVLAVLQGMATGDLALAGIAWRKARLRRLGLRFPLGEATVARFRGPTPRRNRSLR
jgi:ornithine cyclodeaminase